MKIQILAIALLLAAPSAVLSQTTVFNDTFTSGSTIDAASPVSPTPTSSSYEEIASKSWSPSPPTLTAGNLTWGITHTSGGGDEIQALFTTAPVTLQTSGQYIQLTVVFTATEGILTTNMQLALGLFNSGQVLPFGGGINNAGGASSMSAATSAENNGAQNWVGCIAQIGYSGLVAGTVLKSDFYTRPTQNNSSDCNQVTAVNGSSSYGYTGGTAYGASTTPNTSLTTGDQYTEVLNYTLESGNQLQGTVYLYVGSGTSGTLLTTVGPTTITTPGTTTFDALSMGFRTMNQGTPGEIDLNSVQVVTTAPYSGGQSCISQSVTPSSLVMGQTNSVATVTLPAGVTTSGPLSVDLVSSDPSVAYVSGAPGGTLTLTFPQNCPYNVTNLPVVAAESGSTLLYLTNATGGACLQEGASSNLITVACDPITLSPIGSIISLVGQTNQLVNIVISPYANLTGPVTVNLVSLNPSVVTPAGAVNGTLELTFSANATNSQWVNLDALALGTATLILTNSSGPYCTSIASNQILTVTVPEVQGTNMTSEEFPSQAEAAADGWVGFMNMSNEEDYGWSDSQNAGGSNPGEAGGSFVRDTNLSYYADITVGPLTLNDYIYASGTLAIAPSSDNAAFNICYFNTNNPNGVSDNILGIGLADGTYPNSRISAAFGDATTGSVLNNEVFPSVQLPADVPIPWSFSYDPTGGTGYGQLTLNYTVNGTQYTTNLNLSAGARSIGATFNAFGMMVRGVGSLDTTDVMGIYMADVAYTKGYSLAPVANPATYGRASGVFPTPGISQKISVSNLLTHTSDPKSDPVGLVSVAGGALVNNTVIATTTNRTSVYYTSSFEGSPYIVLTPVNNVAESFQYVVQDNTYPSLTATNLITITVTNAVGQVTGSISTSGGSVTTTWAGIPGASYTVQVATSVNGPWTDAGTTGTTPIIAPSSGVFSYTDTSPPQPTAFYRLQQN